MPSAEDVLHELEWRRCKADEKYFLRNHFKIRVPGKGKCSFDLRVAQDETLDIWNAERYTIALKARQIGFSTLAAGHVVWMAMFQPDKFIVMLSRTEREAAKLLLKAKYGYKHLPEWMKERGPKLLDNNMTRMSFSNDSAIESLPSGSDPARGEAVDVVIVDEWAFLPNAEEAWASIEPITDVGGRVIGISTANGSGNFFHEFYVAAKTGSSVFKSIFWPWEAGDRDEKWYEDKKRSMRPWQLHQEYPRDDVECFIKSGNPIFDTDRLNELITVTPARGWLRRDKFNKRSAEFVQSAEGEFQVWDEPVKGVRYVLGVDVAEGLEHGDYSVVWVIEAATGACVAKWRGHIPADLLGSEVCHDIGYWYGRALIGVEANNHGLTTLVALRDSGYPNIYHRTSLETGTKKQRQAMGWFTSRTSKPYLMDGLAAALREDLRLTDAETIAELRTYVRDPDGKMHGSPFDDQVMALGIAQEMRQFVFTPQYNLRNDDYMTGAYMERLLLEQDDGEGTFIGAHNLR